MSGRPGPGTLGGLLRRHRFKAGLSQRALAERAGISVRTLRYLEQDQVHRPRADSIRRLAAALDLPDTACTRLLEAAEAVPTSPQTAAGVRVDVLGPLVLHRDGSAVKLPSVLQAGLMGLLAMQPGVVVSIEEIVDVLWGEQPPRTCRQLVHTYVRNLREVIDPGGPGRGADSVLQATRGGYRAVLSAEQCDAAAFEDLLDQARRAGTRGDRAAALETYGQALRCWRGPVLAGGGERLRAHPKAVALAGLQVTAAVARADLALELGRTGEVVAELREFSAREPLHEELAGRLMLALASCGQQAAALEVFARISRQLDADLGLPPSAQLRAAHLRVLRGEVPARLRTGDARAAVPAQLPAPAAGFTGRAWQLRQLDDLLPDPVQGNDDAPARGVVLVTITGAGGVGKTALAVHWAHQVAGRFPDGQLYVDLRGHGTSPPLTPLTALTRFLVALGIAADRLPETPEAAADLYRTLTAGRRMLVVLDNAADPEQVRPLLPGGPGCMVVVTGREGFGGLIAREGAHRLRLDVLPPEESQALLARLLGAERVAAETQAAVDLADLCAQLPLALRIAAANLIARPFLPLASYRDRLRSGDRLRLLALDGDPTAAVRAAFDLSYTALPAAEQRMFRLLGAMAGPDICLQAAAELAEVPTAQAEHLLERLCDKHLVDEHRPHRYTLHDLLRLYAHELLTGEHSPPEADHAATRLARHYLRHAVTAAEVLYPHRLHLPLPATGPAAGIDAEPARFSQPGQALTWLDTERANLVATAVHCAGHGPRALAWHLASRLERYFHLRVNTADCQTVSEAGLTAAETEGDLQAQAAMHLSLGSLRLRQSRYQAAIDHYTSTVHLGERSGWHEAAAVALNNLAGVYWLRGDAQQAIDHLQRALPLHERCGRLAGQAATLANLGTIHAEQLRGNQEAGPAPATAWADQATRYLTSALALHRRLADRYQEAHTLRVLAEIRRDTGHHDLARDLIRQAIPIADALEDRGDQVRILSTAATIELRLGHHRTALDHHHRALALARDCDDPTLEAVALIELADTYLRLHRHDQAASTARRTLAITGRTGARRLHDHARSLLIAAEQAAQQAAEPTGTRT